MSELNPRHAIVTVDRAGFRVYRRTKRDVIPLLHRDVGPVTCEARVVHLSRRVGTAEARVVDANGKLYAHGSATCLRVEPADGASKSPPSQG